LNVPYRVYNIGNDQPVQLMHFIELLEQHSGRGVETPAVAAGRSGETWADVAALCRDVGYAPNTSIEDGVVCFVDWYREYFALI
jgi:UDP-glucuronate 4-epimerase